MTRSGRPRDPYDVPVVRHRWVFVASIVTWVAFVALEVFVVVYNLRNHTGFGISFWFGMALVVFMATILIRAHRLRRAAAERAQPRY